MIRLPLLMTLEHKRDEAAEHWRELVHDMQKLAKSRGWDVSHFASEGPTKRDPDDPLVRL